MVKYNGKHLIILSGRAGIPFAQEVVAELREKINAPESEDFGLSSTNIMNFSNEEIFVRLGTSVRDKEVHLFQSFHQGDDANLFHAELFELLILINAIQLASAKRIKVYLPFLPYQRQDRKTKGREPITARLIFDLIQAAAYDTFWGIVTADIHQKTEEAFSRKPLDHIFATPLFILWAKAKKEFKKSDLVVISPDVGGFERVVDQANILKADYAVIGKHRRDDRNIEVKYVIGDVESKTKILLDDMGDTLGSVVKGIEAVKKIDLHKENYYAFCSHWLGSKDKDGKSAEEKLIESNITLITTDSIPRTPQYYQKYVSHIKVMTLIPFFADVVWENHLGEDGSVSRALNEHEDNIKKGKVKIEDYLISG